MREIVLPLLRPAACYRLTAVILAAALILGVACSDDSGGNGAETLSDPVATGTELVTKYLTLLQNKDVEGLTDFLSDAFIIQRADGSTSQKAAYVQNIPEINAYTISEVAALQAGDALVVRWSLVVDEVINGQTFKTDPAPRLSTFVYTDGDWRLSSHANFNVPAEN